MYSGEEKKFIDNWEQVRLKESSTSRKIMAGLPSALLFYLPLPVFVAVVYFFFPDWYYRISNRAGGMIIPLLIALFFSAVFLAYFRMQFKWETNENYYLQLKARNKDQQSEGR